MSGPALAGPPLAVLPFGGPDGPSARSTLTSALGRRYKIIDGQAILDACDEMGITMTRGRNLARAAAQVGVVAVIGGAVSGGHLSLAVYSGKIGDVVSSGRVRTPRGRLNKKALRQALTIILKGLRKCPKRAPRPKASPRPRPAPPPEPAPAPTPAPASPPTAAAPSLVFDPDPVVSSGSGTPNSSNLTPYQGGTSAAAEGGEENPLAPPVAKGPPDMPSGQATATLTKKPESLDGTPRLEATLGFGTWMRSLRINQPDPTFPAPKYDSGAAFALALGFKARPLAFFTDGFLASLYSRMGFQTMLGLESRNKHKDATGTEVEETFGTSLWELRWEVLGYDWNVLGKPSSPHVEGGIGFGMMDFAIDWGDSTSRPMPDAAYQYFLVSAGSFMPFYSVAGAQIGGHLRFDYRVVTGAGEIEEDTWYGPSSTGGINLLVGLYGGYKGFIVRAEYSYTRYFYDFTDAETRLNDCKASAATCKRAAGGALDVFHSIMVNLGYGF